MGLEYAHTRDFAGATFSDADMSGITIRDCYVADLKIVSAVVDNLRQFGAAVASLTAAELAEERTATAMPVYRSQTTAVGFILGVVIEELIEHRRYVERDLATLEAQQHDH